VAPIVFANCAVCHRPGEAGPFSLLSYTDVKSRALQIGEVTETRYMPPWLPEPGKGVFKGERRLSDAQIDVIRRWVEAGTPEGDPADLPAPPRFPEGWPLGEPDLVLKTPRPFPLPEEGTDVFWNLVYRSPTERTRYVRAVEIRLPDRKVGHHANLLLDRARAARRLDGRTGVVGFPGMDLAFESEGFDPDSHFAFWKPGTVPEPEPEGMAWRLDRETDLVLNLHLRPSGKPENVAPLIGLYFTDEAPTLHPMLLQLEHDGAIDLPPGGKEVAITDELVLPVAVDVLALYPHAHYLGKEIEGYATLPDGTSKWLIHIKDWDVNWQAVYRLAEPISLPAGTTLKMRWSYDNTEDNVRNPNRPPRRVRAGNRAEDEMGHLWLQVLPRGESTAAKLDPRLLLQEATMRRRLVKYPADFTAHYNLGAALQAQGRLDDAVRELREAVRLGPARATAHTTLGAALQAQGRTGEALREFRSAVRVDPAYASAHYNLGQVYLARDRPEEALPHYREAARLAPDDPEIRAQLGAALQKTGKRKEAVEQYRRALALDPAQANARFNLAQILVQEGRVQEGIAELEEALRHNSADADARMALGLALVAAGRPAEAIVELRKTLEQKPDDLVAHDALGQLLLGQREVDEAIAHLRLVVEGRKGDADACNNLGSALAMKGDLPGARALFERALAIDPNHAAARANLARAGGRKQR
jgi:Flp pilus assembly protein TadD